MAIPPALAAADLPLRAGETLLVHASVRSLAHTGARAEDILAWLRAGLGPAGTLILPTLTYRATPAAGMAFDVRSTPSDTGALPETGRALTGALRSVHPTHSVAAIGPAAAELTRHHALDREPCGANSPFILLPRLGARILFLGCGLRPNTTMHAVEALARPWYLHHPEPRRYRVTDHQGATVEAEHLHHGFSHHRLAQRYDRLWDLLPADRRWSGAIGPCTWHLLDAQAVFAAGLAALVRDPAAFVEPAPPA